MARKKKAEAEAEGSGFIVLFTALSMIMLALFILLFALSHRDETREKVALGSLVGTFGILPGGIRPDVGTTPSVDQSFTVDETDKVSELFNDIATRVARIPDATVRIKQGADETSVLFQPDYLFKPGSLELSDEAKDVLRNMAYFVTQYDVDLQIEGRVAPDEPLPPGKWTVWSFSGARAAVIADYLEREVGISASRLRAAGLGSYRPHLGDKANTGVEILMVRSRKA
ncbi:MAG: OmpA family protein [Myxococcales bacterium]|nr:OmpA family protein [Myxococcales bacterium]